MLKRVEGITRSVAVPICLSYLPTFYSLFAEFLIGIISHLLQLVFTVKRPVFLL